MLRENYLQLEDDVEALTDELTKAHNVITEKDCYIEVRRPNVPNTQLS